MTPTRLAAGQDNSAPVTTTTPAAPTTTTKSGKARKRKTTGPPPVPTSMAADPDDGNSQAAQLGHNVGLPVYYPRNIPDDYSYCFSETGNCDIGYEEQVEPDSYTGSYPRAYVLRDTSDQPAPVLRDDAGRELRWRDRDGQRPVPDRAGHHLDRSADPQRHAYGPHGRSQDARYLRAGGKVSLVAWHRGADVYWIANTLQNAVPAYQMVSMAESFARAKG